MQSETIQLIQSHFDTIITHGTVEFGLDPNPMWLASLDVHTGQFPADSLPAPEIEPRVYRYIHAPGGVNAYWDQPHLVAAHALSAVTGEPRYAEAADRDISASLERSVSACGQIPWGNQYYDDAMRGGNVWFNSHTPPRDIGLHNLTAYLHELRPIPPAWELFWRISPELTHRSIEAMGEHHIFDPTAGGFNCHADQQRGYDYLEIGGILIESLAWLYARTRERHLIDLARRMAAFSFGHRHPATDLLRITSTSSRWEGHTITTEVGLWAGSLLRASAYSGVSQFQRMARDAVAAYLDYGWDAETGQYYGRLNVNDGTPQCDQHRADKITRYQPDTFTDIWNALFPSHDYPLALAESCVTLYERTSQSEFITAVQRWAAIIEARMYESRPAVCYAEQFGRAIHFLLRAADVLDENRYRIQAVELADIAIDQLYAGRMFRGHSGEDRYEAVDGVGYLLLALLYLETGRPPDYMGFGF